jgi:hypothetical protein
MKVKVFYVKLGAFANEEMNEKVVTDFEKKINDFTIGVARLKDIQWIQTSGGSQYGSTTILTAIITYD